MDTILILRLAGAVAASAATPGPRNLMASSKAASDGLPSGLRVVLGISAGKSIQLACSWAMILGTLSLSGTAIPKLLATMIVTLDTGRAPVAPSWLGRAGGLALLGFAGLAATTPV
jgi:hypothetical protein